MATEQDLDAAERALVDAASKAFAEYIAQVKGTVFADPNNPDLLVWPAGLWASIVAAGVAPVVAARFAEVMRGEAVASGAVAYSRVVRSMVALPVLSVVPVMVVTVCWMGFQVSGGVVPVSCHW